LGTKPYPLQFTHPCHMEPITILLVDDHRLIRDSWSFILNSDSRFRVIGETDNGNEAVKIAKTRNPLVVLMDINMAPVNGFDATREIHKFSPGSKVIGVSMHAMPAYAKKILQMGAMGYVTKNSSKEELTTAIVEVNKGNKYICSEVKDILVEQQLEEGGGQTGINNLSRRETEIIHLIKQGLSSKEIGLQLDIALKTVEVHRYNILKKLKLKNTAALVNFINTNGL
jgi:DNA-binding NarL/FixJ family response regulator